MDSEGFEVEFEDKITSQSASNDGSESSVAESLKGTNNGLDLTIECVKKRSLRDILRDLKIDDNVDNICKSIEDGGGERDTSDSWSTSSGKNKWINQYPMNFEQTKN